MINNSPEKYPHIHYSAHPSIALYLCFLCLCIFVYFCLCVFVYLCICVFVYFCVCVHSCACISICVFVCLCTEIFPHSSAHGSITLEKGLVVGWLINRPYLCTIRFDWGLGVTIRSGCWGTHRIRWVARALPPERASQLLKNGGIPYFVICKWFQVENKYTW